ncbi:hypothetical protein CLOM_g16697 [Closterium sp. NIES-68]|nr:hypothetical protein CLOM_g16697 [Closterium sp. NIES-68]GJP82818.1 hypothetical protein CLOP_g13046 [Closterium sp. NIES-67]
MLHLPVASKPLALVTPTAATPCYLAPVSISKTGGTGGAGSRGRAPTTKRELRGDLVGSRLFERSFSTQRGLESGRAVTAAAASAGEGKSGGADRGSSGDMDSTKRPAKMQTVIEHVALFSMAPDMAEEAEGDMLSHLYSLQYHYPHLLAISLGRIVAKRPVGFSHALVARFPSRPALEGFLAHPALAAAMDQFVTPACTDTLSLSYEAQVEADIESVFRRGDSFERGLEHVVLLRAKPAAEGDKQQAMVDALCALPLAIGPDILVQLTAGANFAADTAKGFTHGLVARCPSEEALDAYNKHPSHRQVLRQHVLPFSETLLAVDFQVDPVGREERV